MWAGYLPPGKQSILIYDRMGKKIWQKDVVIEQHPNEENSQMPAPIEYPHTVRFLSKEEIREIDKQYEISVGEHVPDEENQNKTVKV